MSKVDEELTRRLHRAERPVDVDAVFEGLERRRSHRERVRRVQVALLAFAVLAATAGGFLFLRHAFDPAKRNIGDEQTPSVANGEIVFSRPLRDGSEHVFAVQPGVVGERLITSGSATYTDPSVAPDGRAIAVVHSIPSFADMNAEGVIATFTMDGGEPLWITDPLPRVGDPSWSPEGDRIAFAASTSDQRLPGIYVMDSDGSDMRLVAELDGFTLSAPDWSPDGRRLVFVGLAGASSEAEPKYSDLFMVGIDGSGLANLTESPTISESTPSWSPDGDVIAYRRNEGNISDSIQLIDSTGRSAGTVFDDSDAGEIGEIDWSPDGRLIAFTSSLALTDSDIEGNLDVWTVRVDGTQLTNLTTDGASGISWQPVSVGSEPRPSPTSEPTVSPSAEPAGRDIGLGFNVCNLRVRAGLDFGTLPSVTAWTGTRTTEGTCPTEADGDNLVGVDLNADGAADDWAPLPVCTFCEPTGAVDLNRDGLGELVVLMQGGSVANYTLYSLDGPDGDRLRPILLWEYAGWPGFPSGQQVSLWAGGDEGFSASIKCVEKPERTYVVSTQLTIPVDNPDPAAFRWVQTRLVLLADGTLKVWDGESRGPDPVGPPAVEHALLACGLTLDPAASPIVG
jgi:hypothetical protein